MISRESLCINYMYVNHAHTCTHVQTTQTHNKQTCTQMYTHNTQINNKYTHIHTSMHIHTHTHTHTHTCTHTHIHAHIHAHIHTHTTHTYIDIDIEASHLSMTLPRGEVTLSCCHRQDRVVVQRCLDKS